MQGGKRSIVAIVLSIAVLIVWQVFFNPKQPNTKTSAESAVTQTAQTETSNTKDVFKNANAAPQNTPEQTVKIANQDLEVELTNVGATVNSWKTVKYKQTTKNDSELMNLAEKGSLKTNIKSASFSIPEESKFQIVSQSASEAVFKWSSNEIDLIKKISLPQQGYASEVSISVKNKTSAAIRFIPETLWIVQENAKEKTSFLSFPKKPAPLEKNAVVFLDNSVKRWNKVKDKKETGVTDVLWSGVEDRYFITAFVPRSGTRGNFVDTVVSSEAGKQITTSISTDEITASPGEEVFVKYTVYSGPKDRKLLESLNVGLDKSIDYGWFSILAVPLFYLLQIFYKVSNNYGIAIILLTIFVRLILHPINSKSLKSMKEMQKVQPQLKEIQAKYKDDRQKVNMETMKLFKRHNINPLGGCLPMLLQFPVFIALYRVLWNSVQLYHAPFFGFYKDLSAPDPYLVAPVLMGISMFLQQKLTPSTADPSQKTMMMIMPVMFTAFMLFLPAGLVIYIFISTMMAVSQQYMYNKGFSWWKILGFKKKTT